MSVLKHREHSRLPRHLQSHNHLGAAHFGGGDAACAAITATTYPACARGAVSRPTPAAAATAVATAVRDDPLPASASASTLADFTVKREEACEKWLDEFAESVNKRHYVTSALAYGTFAPNNKESLTKIFTLYSGAQQ